MEVYMGNGELDNARAERVALTRKLKNVRTRGQAYDRLAVATDREEQALRGDSDASTGMTGARGIYPKHIPRLIPEDR
jgi:hypothetical protein